MIKIQKVKILLVVAVIFLAGAGFFYLKENRVNETKNDITSEVSTSDWLVHENKEYGYRFKYPQGAKIVTGSEFPNRKNKSTSVFIQKKYPELRKSNFYDEYEINIQSFGNLKQYGGTIDDIIRQFSKYGSSYERAGFTKNDMVVLQEKKMKQSYIIIGKNEIYQISLLKQNPENMKELLGKEAFQKSGENYAQDMSIFKNIYSTFETLD